MLPNLRQILALCCLCLSLQASGREGFALNVAVLDGSPPMSYRDSSGQITGFSMAIMRALCEEMKASCQFRVVSLDRVLSVLESGECDMAAAALLDTPERRARVLLSRPIFRSRSVWFAKPGLAPGNAKALVAVVRSSAQERYAEKQGWKTVSVLSNQLVTPALESGLADAALVPMPTALGMMMPTSFQKMGLVMQVMDDPALGGDASYPVAPRRPELKQALDAAIEQIKRDGRYDRINSEFLPFRVE